LLPFPEPPAEERTETHEQLWWFRDPTTNQQRLPRIFNPSKADSPAMAVAETISLGERMTIGSAVDWTTVGHAVHAAMALAFVDSSRPIALDDVQRILNGYQVSAHVSASALTAQVITVTQWISKQWPGCRTLPEWPVEAILPIGQVLNGRIDLLVDTGSHWVLIDHKSNPGARSAWPELANTHGGQLLAYKAALEMATGKPVKEIWLVLPVAGGAIRIEKAATA
jgi:ATP-dependent exoDNAse (exonuclease V) beta subunit